MPASGPVPVRNHAREMRRHSRGDRPGQQRNHHAHKAVGIGQRGNASGRQHRSHGLIHQQAAGGRHAAQQHRPVLPRHFTRGLGGSVPPQAKTVAARVHHRRHGPRMNKRSGQRRVNHRPDSVAAAQRERSQNDEDRSRHRSQCGPGKAVESIQNGGAVGGDSRNQHHRQQRVEETDGKLHLFRRKVRGNQRKKAARGESHHGNCRGQQQADPKHRAR